MAKNCVNKNGWKVMNASLKNGILVMAKLESYYCPYASSWWLWP
jgi:hypothetical protein